MLLVLLARPGEERGRGCWGPGHSSPEAAARNLAFLSETARENRSERGRCDGLWDLIGTSLTWVSVSCVFIIPLGPHSFREKRSATASHCMSQTGLKHTERSAGFSFLSAGGKSKRPPNWPSSILGDPVLLSSAQQVPARLTLLAKPP